MSSNIKSKIKNKNDEKKLEECVDHVKNSILPQYRPSVEIRKFHRFMLNGTKIKKQLTDRKQKKPKKPSKTLSRKQHADLGLYTLPTKSLKYSDMLSLHTLWTQYIQDHLKGFLVTENGQHRIPHAYENTYDAFSKALVKSDFHGANITVIASKSPTLVGQNGIVAMETKNTFKIVGKDNRTRTIPKPESVFKILMNDMEFTIFGKYFNIRPAERSVKKIKSYMEPDL